MGIDWLVFCEGNLRWLDYSGGVDMNYFFVWLVEIDFIPEEVEID